MFEKDQDQQHGEEEIIKDNQGNKIYLFKDFEHQNVMLENLNMLRKNRQFCDVILQLGSNQDVIHEVYAHKVVLSSSSPYLLEMFTTNDINNIINNGNGKLSSTLSLSSKQYNNNNNTNNNNNGNYPQQYRLSILNNRFNNDGMIGGKNHRFDYDNNNNNNDNNNHYHHHQNNNVNNNNNNKNHHNQMIEFDPEAFDCIIDYAYTSILKIPLNKIKEIYSIATRLKMSNIILKCGKVLLSTLSSENCIEIRNMKTVLKDINLLKSIDSFIRQNFEKIVQTSSFETQISKKIKIEFLLNSEQEENQINDRHMFNEIIEWIHQSYQRDTIDLEKLIDNNNVLMLYYNKDKNEIEDCCQIETNSEMIEDYKRLNRKISLTKSLSNDNITNITTNGHNNSNNSGSNNIIKPSKPRQFLFTRSDSESSISSLADQDHHHQKNDHENDWKVLATCRIGQHTLVGLVTILGQLSLLSITLKIKDPPLTSSATSSSMSSKDHYNRMDRSISGGSSEQDSDAEYCLIPSMSSARCSVGTAEFFGKLFVCGGYDRGECLKTVELYDSTTNRWEFLQPMKNARGRFAVAVVDRKVYAIGGSNGHDELNSAEYYDPDKSEWKYIQSTPVARSNAGMCALDGKIYMIGGWNGGGLQRCDVYDPKTDCWSEIVPLNNGRYQMGACVLNNIIYAVGGCDSWSCLNTVEAYYNSHNHQPSSSSSSNGKSLWHFVAPLQTARRGCGVAAYNGKIYAVGGHDGMHALCSVEIYDPINDEWTFGKPMTTARANVGVAVVQDRLYAVGGFNGKIFLNTIEYFDFEMDQWTTSIPINDKKKISTENNNNNNNNNNDMTNSTTTNQNLNGSNRKEINHHSKPPPPFNSEPLMEVEEVQIINSNTISSEATSIATSVQQQQ